MKTIFQKCGRFALIISTITMAHAGSKDASVPIIEKTPVSEPSRWAYEIGYAWITKSDIDDFLMYDDKPEIQHGPTGGNIYYLTASYHLGDLPMEIFGQQYRPRMEIPLTVDLFDEKTRSPFFDFNAAWSVRWVDFPWNDYIKTSFMTGVGPSYSTRIPLEDERRHEDMYRSYWKFNWPIQLALALPSKPQHQLTFFIDHQSGGHIFDVGGLNNVGIGYRYQP